MKILHKNDRSNLTRSAICAHLLTRFVHTSYCNNDVLHSKYVQSSERVSPHGSQHENEQISVSGATCLRICSELSVNRIEGPYRKPGASIRVIVTNIVFVY